MKLVIRSWSITFELRKMDSRYKIESVKYPDYRQMQGGGLKEGDLNEGYSFVQTDWSNIEHVLINLPLVSELFKRK